MDRLKEAGTLRKTRTLDYTIKFICYLLILLPAALGVLYVRAYGVSVVRNDAWSMVPLFDRWASGTLQVSDFFVQHNEHRSTFPELTMLLLGIITKYNTVAEMYLIQICLLVVLVILLLAFRANNKSLLGLLLFVPISLLVFSFKEHANFLFGYQINFTFVETFGVLTLFLLYVVGHRRFKKTAFAAALVSATVATYSVVQGLLVWPAGLLQLFIVPLDKSKKRLFVILWGLVGVSEWIAYLRGWSPSHCSSSFIDWCQQADESGGSSSGPDLLYILQHPLEAIDFFLKLLGNSLLWPRQSGSSGDLFWQNLTSVAGLLIVCLALVSLLLVYKNRRLGECSFWVSLVLYSFLILAAITEGRSYQGVREALHPRYTSFSILAVVSIYGLLATVALGREWSIRRPNISAILVVLLSGAVLLGAATISYPKGITAGRAEREKNENLAFVLSTYKSQPDKALGTLVGNPEVVRERAPVLQRLGYNVFSGEPKAYRGLKKSGLEK